MSYQVLARKWRPRSFAEMVGQPHVLQALVNALKEGRLHHAYLFTGTRGVGKTTVARILAKCLNCEQGVGPEPCGRCAACEEIDQGRFVDLIEVDAASRTKVEDTRELLDNVQYAPTRGRYKVYLIDEVHMLSGHSFNALLKTLEEPPPHVKFLLATTDPQKLPPTILSRCLQFNLKRMPAEVIATHLRQVLDAESIEHETAAADALARAADGSMRDALSLLDQAIAFGAGSLREAQVREMLGTVSREHIGRILEAVASADASGAMQALAELAERAPDFGAVLAELIAMLHRVALLQVVPSTGSDDSEDSAVARTLAERLSPEAVQLYYQIALVGRRDLALAPDPRAGCEMTLLRMLAFRPAGGASSEVPVSGRRSSIQAAAARPAEANEPISAPPQQDRRVQTEPTEDHDWGRILDALGLKAVAHALASNCCLKSYAAGELVLTLSRAHEDLRTPSAEARLAEALNRHFEAPVRLVIELDEPASETPAQALQRGERERQASAEASIAEDGVTQALKDTFDAELVPGSVKPL